uniref:Uncharacterized protein n=1 Tax=Chlamydomonas euryale TaxID=1486919 RepID=A0A7R9V582_9CHLO|mmetsp:Transcript_20552/g.61283  ORF Transcript_20552/g.61283 Transcript_20552/m.61283 type:complete len:246 (+) Transcript_20552:236-973(+)
MNNNKLDEASLLAGGKGVFSKTSYVTLGSKEKPEPYVTKAKDRDSFLGKQFAGAVPKDGKTVDVYFEKKHNWISDGDKYVDKQLYKDKQGEKKKGFYTSDWSKRDEFSNTIRTNQYREQLKGESKFNKRALELLGDSGEDNADALAAFTSKRAEDDYMYDRIFESGAFKEDGKFDGASKTHRDTKNKCQLSTNRQYGGTMTTNTLAFQAPTEFEKPEHARKPLVRDTFYRKTNIFFPAGISADPA